MDRRRLGNTDITVSAISFGASSLGHAFRPVGLDAALESVRVALELGITHIDTSAFYGRGVSEVLLGIALRDVPRDQFTVSTKLGRYDEDKFDFRPERVVESVDTSLFRLGLDVLDIAFLHDVEFTDFRVSVEQALPVLLKEKEKGKIRCVGIAGYPFQPVRWVMNNFPIDVTLNYNHYTLQNQRLVTELVPELATHNVAVLNASPFAQRLLTHTELPSWHPADPESRQVCRQAVEHCLSRGVDPAKLCVQFSTHAPELPTCVIGSGNPDNIRRWAQWLDEPYEAAMIAEVQEILRPVMNRNFVYGLPENNDAVK